MRYYVLIKRKSAKSWVGAIPARKGVSLKTLRRTISSKIKKGFTYRIVTSKGLKAVLMRQRGKNKAPKKRRTVKRKTMRKKR